MTTWDWKGFDWDLIFRTVLKAATTLFIIAIQVIAAIWIAVQAWNHS